MSDKIANENCDQIDAETSAKVMGGYPSGNCERKRISPAPKKISCSEANTPSHQTKVRNNPIFFGTLTELYFTVQMIERGFNLWKPVLPDSKTDFIIHNGNRYLKIQVKGVYGLNPKGGRHVVSLRAGNKRYSAKDVDFFACYVFDTNKWYILPFQESSSCFIVSPASPQLHYLDNWDSLWKAS